MPQIELEAADGHVLGAYRAEPSSLPAAAVVLVHEMYGVNDHIRDVADRFAKAGFLAIAPALFDRLERRVSLAYTPEGLEHGAELAGKVDREKMLIDLEAARALGAEVGKVALVGYRFGGAVAWVAANRMRGLACAVSYYGSRVVQFLHLAPKIPVTMHVGLRDTSFPIEKIQQLATKYPDVEIHEYDAGHGFNNDRHADYRADVAGQAFERTLTFIRKHTGGALV